MECLHEHSICNACMPSCQRPSLLIHATLPILHIWIYSLWIEHCSSSSVFVLLILILRRWSIRIEIRVDRSKRKVYRTLSGYADTWRDKWGSSLIPQFTTPVFPQTKQNISKCVCVCECVHCTCTYTVSQLSYLVSFPTSLTSYVCTVQ